jgi:hypothetical protein
VLINVNWGHDAVLSTQQAKQFGVLDKMKLVVPYQVPFIARVTIRSTMMMKIEETTTA